MILPPLVFPGLAVLTMCMYLSTWRHAHIYSLKLGPGLVLLAKVCPGFKLWSPTLKCLLLPGANVVKLFCP